MRYYFRSGGEPFVQILTVEGGRFIFSPHTVLMDIPLPLGAELVVPQVSAEAAVLVSQQSHSV